MSNPPVSTATESTPPAGAPCYGLDIGGTKIELVAFDGGAPGFAELYRRRVATPAQDFEAFVEAIAELVMEADQALACIGRVGLGLPGIISPQTGLQLSSNVPALSGRAVPQALRERLGRPVAIGNDCQCFALSEAQGGAAEGFASMFGAILGTGAGGGFCVQGRLIAGYNGLAGEWGHWALPALLQQRHRLPLLACACGLQSCVERYVSGSGLATLFQHFGGPAGQSVPEIVAAADAGEVHARQALTVHLDLLGHALAGLIMAYDPHVLVLGGGLSKLQSLYTDLPEAIGPHLFQGVSVPPILPPRFGDAGGARGAALLARQRLS